MAAQPALIPEHKSGEYSRLCIIVPEDPNIYDKIATIVEIGIPIWMSL
jgi:hypothetical protein